MLSPSSYRTRRELAWYSRLALCTFVAALLIPSAMAQTQQAPGQFGLDFVTPGDRYPWMRAQLRVGNNIVIVHRNELIVSDAEKAGDFTAVYVKAELDGDVVKVTLSIIYNDLSDREWVLHKRETPAGFYELHDDESVRPVELSQFGIAPFELKLINAKGRPVKPGEGPRIINKTTSLQVEKVEMHMDGYHLWLRNTSDKSVTAFTMTGRNRGVTAASEIGHPIIVPGKTHEVRPGSIPGDEITISLALFEDGSFEGDSEQGLRLAANAEGMRIEAPSVLRRIEQVLMIDDGEFTAAFDKLEAELWLISEAIDKQSAIDLLRIEQPSLDDKRLSELYEDLKGGLYDARNLALREMGNDRRNAKNRFKDEDILSTAKYLRETLERVKQSLERIVSSKK